MKNNKQKEKQEKIKQEKFRAPIVVVLGQVDHGKTTLLDYIRKTNLAEKEIGKITQDIGAYEAEHKGEKIIFIDTPGHQAFTKLRRYGGKIADIGILIIDAVEGVMPQTIESIEILKKEKMPFIVALNKIDKPNANPQKVKNQLLEKGVQVEELGGDIPCVEISAKTGKNIDELLEILVLLSKIQELKPKNIEQGEGFIISGKEDPKKGIEVDLILKHGKIKIFDYIITEASYGRVRRIEDSFGRQLNQAQAPKPLRIYGFEKVPDIGENFKIVSKKDYEYHKEKLEEFQKEKFQEKIFGNKNRKYSINLIIKAPSKPLLDAVFNLFSNLKLKNSFVVVKKADVGVIDFYDILYAHNTNSFILGFKVGIEKSAILQAERLKVNYKTYDIIYELEKEVYELLKANIKKDIIQEPIGKAKVLKNFRFNRDKNYQIIGGIVEAGFIKKGEKFKIIRRGVVLGEGKCEDLESNRVKQEKIKQQKEFGAKITGVDFKIQQGDILEFYIEKELIPEI